MLRIVEGDEMALQLRQLRQRVAQQRQVVVPGTRADAPVRGGRSRLGVLLRELGCHEVQGFLFSKPLTAGDFAATHNVYLSDNLAEPVIKLNEYLAYLKKASDLLNFGKKK